MGSLAGRSTGFVGSGGKSAVASFSPCHIFGDQTLIGTGIRIGFYLLYAAAVVAVLFGVDKQFRFWHGAWAVLALSLFVSLFLNTADHSLIIIDYAVLIQLVLWYPVYSVFTVLFRQALVVDGSGEAKSDAEYRERLQRCRRTAVTDLDVGRARAYAEVLKAFALHAAAEDSGRDLDGAQAALIHAVQHYVSHWHEQIDVQDGRYSEEVHVDGGAVTTVYNTELIGEIAAAPTRADVDKLRDLYVAALVHSQLSVAEARATEQEVVLIASDELCITRGARRAKQALRDFLFATSYKDQLTAAIGLLVWSTYMFGTAALYWPLLRNGSKPDGACDNVPTVYFVFAPKKPFADDRFATFLRVWTVGVCIVAFLATAAAATVVAMSIFGPAIARLVPAGKQRRNAESVEAGQAEHGKQQHLQAPDVHSSPDYSRRARSYHTQEILACLHHGESRSIQHRYWSRHTPSARFSLRNVPWAALLAALLVVAVVCAELTVARQGPDNDAPLDFARPPLHDTSEILALLIGLCALLLTLLSVVGAAVAAVVRKSRRGSGRREVRDQKKQGEGELRTEKLQ